MKKILFLNMVLLLIISMLSFAYAIDNGINVSVDNENVSFIDSAPFIDENSRTLVPLRAIGEAMGIDVKWDNLEKTAAFTKIYNLENTPACGYDSYVGKEIVTFTVNSKIARVETCFYPNDYTVQGVDDNNYSSNGWTNVTMDTAAIIRDSRTYAPVRYLADSFRFKTDWNGTEKTVELLSSKVPQEAGFTIENVAYWKEYQGWVYHTNKESKIKSIEILEVLRFGDPLTVRLIDDNDKSSLKEMLPELFIEGKILTGFVVDSVLDYAHNYKYTFKLKLTLENGTQEIVTYNDYIYFDEHGSSGGYI